MVGPPRMSITPKEVRQNRKTMDAADAKAGASRGRVTHRRVCHGDAPSVRACSSGPTPIPSQKDPTVRTTMATLKNAWARSTAQMVWSIRSTPLSRLSRSNRAVNAPPTTTVGSTNGTVVTARSAALPRNRWRANRWQVGSAITTVITVEAAACQRVNQTT